MQEISIDYTDCQKLAPYVISTSTGFEKIPEDKVSESFKAATCNQHVPQWKRMNTTHTYRNFTTTEPSPQCSIQFTIPHDLDPPVFLYYRLTNFYQNHRRYVKSLDTKQLKGDALPPSTIKDSNCDPLRISDEGKPYYPCGLIANSLFNDSFSQPLLLNVGDNAQMNRTYNMTNRGIAWDSDKALYGKTKYKPEDISVPPNWRNQYPKEGYSDKYPPPNLEEYEELQVWMRTAGLPAFSKLAMRNDKENMSCGTYRIDITDSRLPMTCCIAADGDKISTLRSTVEPSPSSFLRRQSWEVKTRSWASPTLLWEAFVLCLVHYSQSLILSSHGML